MKKILALIMASLLVLNVVGCGKTASNAPVVSVNLSILKEQDNSMINTYTLIAVDDGADFVNADGASVDDVEINVEGADNFINWMLSEGAELAKNYGYDKYGEYLFYLLDNYPHAQNEVEMATDDTKTIRVSTTTSVNDSGLLSYLIPIFEKKYGYKVEVYSAGTGKAIANAKAGNADLILVHAKAQEETFVKDGYARVVGGFDTERLSYMYNFFVLCGPNDDPAGVKNEKDVLSAFKKIADGKHKFVSRGDNSGTHTKEISLWPKELGITTDPESFKGYTDWYISSNAGMGTCLLQASEVGAYILSDKATFLTFIANGGKIK